MSKQNVGNLKQEKHGERTKPDEREKKKDGGNQKRRQEQLAIIGQRLRKINICALDSVCFCLFLILLRQSWKIVANCKMEKTNFQFGFEVKLKWGIFTQKRLVIYLQAYTEDQLIA